MRADVTTRRPTIRPAHQRYPQPNFVFPMTPPSTAGLEALAPEQRGGLDVAAHPPSSSSPSPGREKPGEKQIRIRRQRHRRAMSDSTVPETCAARESRLGGFEAAVAPPDDEQRPRTVEDVDTGRAPLLEVSIPSYRIGTPRFSVRGTPFIRASYAPTDDLRSSCASFSNRRTTHEAAFDTSDRPGPLPASQTQPAAAAADDDDDDDDPSSTFSTPSPRLSHGLRAAYMSPHLVIEPAMFDALTFKPTCDDRTVVRYSASGSVTAASPPRLVAEITSPSFLDYELLSDFFLTYRSFLDPPDLLRMLFARLRWALARDDEVGMVVRVRTFVALRHWVLNYFVDDFVVDYDLRVAFCALLNQLVDELSQDLKAQKVPLKILGELKKCWRRACAQFWDGPAFDASLGPEVPISPGGIAGHRDPNLDPSFWPRSDSGTPQLDDLVLPSSYRSRTSFYADAASANYIDAVVAGDRPATPDNAAGDDGVPERDAASPTSIASADVVSCSFPTKNARFAQAGASYPAAHPVDPSTVYNPDPIATTPRALVGKRARPNQAHRRNRSLSDSLRDRATMTERALYKNAELLLALPYAGGLVRGNLLPPSQAVVEVDPRSASRATVRQTTQFQSPPPAELSKANATPSAMSGQGMKKLLSSVRRVLSSKGQSVPPTQGAFLNVSPPGPRGATTNRIPGTPVVPQTRGRQAGGARPLVRIDLLGAEVAEDFRRAVREDASTEAERSEQAAAAQAQAQAPGSHDSTGDMLAYSAEQTDIPHIDVSNENPDSYSRPTSDMGFTTSSQSIVIVDGTSAPHTAPAMTGALTETANSSVEAFPEPLVPGGADPTPPTTPPAHWPGTHRKSSLMVGPRCLRQSWSADPLPPFVPDMDAFGDREENARPSLDGARPSLDSAEQYYHDLPPPLSWVRGHMRQASGRSYASNRSRGLRHHASFTSAVFRESTVRSFDATTVSGQSIDDTTQNLVPQPLRVLRRKPGGDLRAAAYISDLDNSTLRRSHSVGSLTTFTDSIRSSYLRSPVGGSSGYVDVVASDCSPGRVDTFSLGAIAEQNPKQHLSLFSTHSSKPVMRPSFEAEALKLAQIPDDMDDDGGVESALLKLEGKYPRKPVAKLSMDLIRPPEIDVIPSEGADAGEAGEDVVETGEDRTEDGRAPRQLENEPHRTSASSVPTSAAAQGDFLNVTDPRGRHGIQSFLSDDSRASYSSTPLLDGGLTDDERSRRTVTREWTDRSVLQGPSEGHETPSDRRSIQDSQHPSYDFVKKTDSLDQVRPGAAMPTASEQPHTTDVEQSFLDVGSDNASDISSEMSAERPDGDDDDDDDDDDGDDIFAPSNVGAAAPTLPVHPLAGDHQPNPAPPSPPITLPQAAQIPQLQNHQVWDKPLPPTPDTTPTTAGAPGGKYPPSSPVDPTGTKEALRNAPRVEVSGAGAEPASAPHSKYSAHLPFILAFDSDTLAQQFTLVEKDALNEIDWRELIDMRWKHGDQNGVHVRSWVSFLRDTDARGVEVVIARFNIMVKWAISEIVLTQDMEERARCIIKFIHIAAHCRRYRNFATMAQVTIALTSNEVGRLTKTWALVPAGDRQTLRDLEALMSPTRNFYNLRAEMEGGAGTEAGCIPFVGIYTHDLLFNAQKPSEIAGSPTTPPLVNFERCRTAAAVAKTLLRLLEASAHYSFQPIEGVTERCLWMGALPDDEIRRLSDALE